MTQDCPRCLFTSDIATIGPKQCNYCDLHDELERRSDIKDLDKSLNKIRNLRGKYNCLIGISGGLDSCTLLWAAVKLWDLRPLVIHFDNGFNAPAAEHNMKSIVDTLGVDLIRYSVNSHEYRSLNAAFIYAGTPDADIPNDVAMTKLMYQTAEMYKIKYILNGHDFRNEGSTPAAWTYMDAEYIRSVWLCYRLLDFPLKNFPLFTFWDQIRCALKGIKQVRPFHYPFDREKIEQRMKENIGWEDYGAKHNENIYTAFVGSWLLPTKFGIDKRRVYLSARIRSGYITKDEAKKALEQIPWFDYSDPFCDEMRKVSNMIPVVDRKIYGRYNFKKYRAVIWLLMKLKVVPYTFYKKYCF